MNESSERLRVSPLPDVEPIGPQIARRRLSGDAIATWLVLGVLVVLLIVPMLVILLGAFLDERPTRWRTANFTLENFAGLFQGSTLIATQNTVLLTVVTLVVATVLGSISSFLVTRTDLPGRRIIGNLIIATIYVPAFVGALGWTALFGQPQGFITTYLGLNWDVQSMSGMIVVSVIYLTPIVHLVVSPAMISMDRSLEESAEVFGLSKLSTLRRITLPLMAPAILAAAVLVAVRTVSEFGIPLVLGLPNGISVLTTQIFRNVSIFPANYNLAAVIALELLVVGFVGVTIQRRLTAKTKFYVTGGRGSRPSRISLGIWRIPLTMAMVAYLAFALVMPFLALFISSLFPYLTTDLSERMSFDNYVYVLTQYPKTANAMISTGFLGIGASVIAVIIGALAAYLALRGRSRLRGLLTYFALLPFAIPHMVMGVGVLWVVAATGIGYGTMLPIYLVLAALFVPYVYQTVSARLEQIHPSLEEAAAVFGASGFIRGRLVVLPLVASSAFFGGILVFVHVIYELSATVLLIPAGQDVVSTAMYDIFTEGSYPNLYALAVIQSVLVLVLVSLVSICRRRENQ